MKHPFQVCATKYCCFCVNCGPSATCYVIASMAIAINGFSWMCNFGVNHWALYASSSVNMFLHLLAGILLFLGTVWGKVSLKIAYCWLCLLCLLTAIAGLALYLVFRKHSYVIWDDVNKTTGMVVVIVHSVWLILWDIYTPMVVLGNLYPECDYCDYYN